MSQTRLQSVASFAASATLSAYYIVGITGTNTVGVVNTTTMRPIGVTKDRSEGGAGSAVAVVMGGTAKVQLASAVTAGQVVVSDGTGLGTAGTILLATTTSTIPYYVGKAVEGGATGAVIEVTVNPIA